MAEARSQGMSLVQLSLLGLGLGLLLVLGLFLQLYDASEKAVMKSADLLADLENSTRQVQAEVAAFLGGARELVEQAEAPDRLNLWRQPGKQTEAFLQQGIAAKDDLLEYTFTWPRGQISAAREPGGKVVLRRVMGAEPSRHPTYTTLAEPRNRGEALWSDLHYSQIDRDLPQAQRRVVVTVQKALYDGDTLLGVIRVGRSTEQLDRVRELGTIPGWLFLCAPDGKLVTRLSKGDTFREQEGEIRVAQAILPQAIERSLFSARAELQKANPQWTGKVATESGDYFAAFRPLEGTQDWIVGMVWSQDYFLAPLHRARRGMLLSSLLLVASMVVLVVLGLRRIHSDLSGLVQDTARMRELDFSASTETGRLREVQEVSQSLEGAKATLRAAVKYVPIDLVRLLFSQALEPRLGGELRELSLMFTDVAGFTTTAEQVDTDELARRLADYLKLMNDAIRSCDGAVLERVGDALLVIWNAPRLTDGHPLKCCRAALESLRLTAHLEWRTRFGLHYDRVMVGHFGAEDRMNYGVLGDGVNLASRIEGLNKHYGTDILATQPLVDRTGDGMQFRKVDVVAVKGKTQGITIYELMGEKGKVPEPRLARAAVYEQAFALYLEREFRQAEELLAEQLDDGPSKMLVARCAAYRQSPPPESWDGVFVATFK